MDHILVADSMEFLKRMAEMALLESMDRLKAGTGLEFREPPGLPEISIDKALVSGQNGVPEIYRDRK